MKKAALVLAAVAAVFTGHAVGAAPCNYAAGETLLTGGGYITSTYSDCHWYYLGDCGTWVTTERYACMGAGGQITRSGIMTVTRHGLYHEH